MMTIDKRWLWAIPIAILLIVGYMFMPKPQPSVTLQVEYAKLKEHSRITDSLLIIAATKSTTDSAELAVAMMNLEKLYADTDKIKRIYVKAHNDVRAADLNETIEFSAGHLPKSNPYK